MLAEQPAEAGGVEDGAGADDAGGRQAGEAGGDLGHHVHGIGGDEQDRVRGGVEHAADHVAEDGGVAAEEVEAGLARDLRHAGGDDDDAGAGEGGIAAVADAGGRGEGDGVGDVLGLGAGERGIVVHQHDLGGRAGERHGVGGGAADLAGSDDADLHCCPPGNTLVPQATLFAARTRDDIVG